MYNVEKHFLVTGVSTLKSDSFDTNVNMVVLPLLLNVCYSFMIPSVSSVDGLCVCVCVFVSAAMTSVAWWQKNI